MKLSSEKQQACNLPGLEAMGNGLPPTAFHELSDNSLKLLKLHTSEITPPQNWGQVRGMYRRRENSFFSFFFF